MNIGKDIYSYAESIDYNADYYESSSGIIFKIQDYGRAIKSGLPTHGIEVIDSLTGQFIGFATKLNN